MQLAPAVGQLREEANAAMPKGPFSVVHKPMLAPSGDRHDYFSHAIYVWPNPKRPDGLPWEYRDGKANPDAHKYDKGWLEELASASATLALAGYLLGERRYCERAALLIRTWFIAPETRQNPHFSYADMIPGRTGELRRVDHHVIDLAPDYRERANAQRRRCLAEVDDQALRTWFSEYFQWAEVRPTSRRTGRRITITSRTTTCRRPPSAATWDGTPRRSGESPQWLAIRLQGKSSRRARCPRKPAARSQ